MVQIHVLRPFPMSRAESVVTGGGVEPISTAG